MAVYYTVTCPHCRKIAEHRKNNASPYGTPFRTCPYCGKVYIDASYVEIGLLDNEDIKKRSFSWGAVLILLLGIVLFVTALSEMVTAGILSGLACIGFGAFNIIYNICHKPEDNEELQEEIRASKARLSDPHYVIALWKNECPVTPEIVAWAKREVGSAGLQVDLAKRADVREHEQ